MSRRDPFAVAREYETTHPGEGAAIGHWSDTPPASLEGRNPRIVARVRVHPGDPDVRIWGYDLKPGPRPINTERLMIYYSPEEKVRLETYAAREGISQAEAARRALKRLK